MLTTIINFSLAHKEFISLIAEVFTAFSTVGSVMVALWLTYKDKPKLRVYATVGIIFPEQSKHLWLSCINISKQAIPCTGFSFDPNRFQRILRNSPRIMPTKTIEHISSKLPIILQYGGGANIHHDAAFFSDKTISKFLGEKRWLARLKLKHFWRIVAHTNINEFSGKLSDSLINEILAVQFPEHQLK